MRIYNDITQLIGSTPLVELQRIGKGLPGRVLVKLEFFNPLGSVKDRIGLQMINAAEKAGTLKEGMTVLEPTSGNTGIALAFVCAAKGYPLTLVMPESVSLERRTLSLLLGAEVILTPAAFGMRGAVAKSLELAEKNKKYFLTRQFENPANPEAHYRTTGIEIWQDTGGQVDMVVCGVGTGGTITGVGQLLMQKNPKIKMVAVEPEESAVLSGKPPGPHLIQGIGAGFVPKVLDKKVIDIIEKVSSKDALIMAKELIKKEGIPVGISSGAALVAALRHAAKPEMQGKTIVAIIPSYTERYLSTALAEEERTKAQQLPVANVEQIYLDRVNEV